VPTTSITALTRRLASPLGRTRSSAAFRQDNTVGAFFASEARNSQTFQEPGFNPWNSIKGTKYEPHWQNFSGVRNTRHAEDMKRQIDREEEDRKLLSAAPWYQSLPAQMVAGIVDWPTLIPGGAFVRSATGGISVARTAGSVGIAAGLGTLAQETALQNIEATRTKGESAFNIGASVFLGGLLGAGAGKLVSRGEWFRAARDMDRNTYLGVHVPGTFVPGEVLSDVGAPASKLADHFAGFEAYHGSPHDFDRFDISKIGTGEGAQAYGHGLYFAENEGVARSYRDQLRPDPTALDVLRNTPGALDQEIGRLQEMVVASRSQAATETDPALKRQYGLAADRAEAEAQQYQRLKDDPNAIIGRLYKVHINAHPEKFLDWDKPLNEQSEHIKSVVKSIDPDGDLTRTGADFYHSMHPDSFTAGLKSVSITSRFNEQTTSEILNGAGIPGIKYLDQGSRDAGDGTRNFVVFDDALVQITDKDGVPITLPQSSTGSLSSLGAAAFEPSSIQGNTIAGRMAETLAESTRRLNPALRLNTSPSAVTRDITGKLVENSLYLKKNFEGIASDPAAETLMKEWNGGLARAIGSTDETWSAYRKAGGELGRDEFRQEVGKAMRRGDTHDIPEVAQVAQQWRSQIFDPLKDAAIKAKLLPEGVQVDTAASYFSRMWNRNTLIAKEGQFKGVVEKWLQEQSPRWMTEFDRETTERAAKLSGDKLREYQVERRIERDARFEDIPGSSRETASEVYNTLTGKTAETGTRPEFITVKARGPLKERTFNIPDELVEDFLEHDVERVGRRYARVMGADVEIANRFNGSVDLKDELARVRDDYGRLRQGITDEKQLSKLDASEKSDIRDLEWMRDLLRGTRNEGALETSYGRMVRSVNHFNYWRSMGEVVLASVTDAVRPAMVHGLGQFLGDIPQFATNIKGVRLSVQEAQLAGNVTERALGTRLATLSEITDPYSSRSPIEAFLENMTNVSSKWNGIRLWTDWMKSTAAVMTQNRILKNIENFGAVKDKERAYLAYLGVDQSMAERIGAQFAEHGETIDRVRVANTESWTDPVAVRAYRAAMNKDVDSIIVQKGVSDVPLFAHTPTGRALLQFKSFALASHQRVLLRGLQEDQARFVGGMVGMTMAGMFITWAKAVSGNRTEKLEEIAKNPGWWIAEGFDRSGVMSVPMELANTFEKATGGFNPIKTPLKAFDQGSAISQKNQNRNEIGSLLGPTVGLAGDVLSTGAIPSRMLKGEEVSQSQKNAAERLLPFNSYAGVRQMLRYVVNPPQ
jgi:hypothetical protein